MLFSLVAHSYPFATVFSMAYRTGSATLFNPRLLPDFPQWLSPPCSSLISSRAMPRMPVSGKSNSALQQCHDTMLPAYLCKTISRINNPCVGGSIPPQTPDFACGHAQNRLEVFLS